MADDKPVGALIPITYQFSHPVTRQPATPTAAPAHRITPIGGSDLAYSGVVTSLGSGTYQLAVSATAANGFSAGGYTVRTSAMYSSIGYRGAIGAFMLTSAPAASAGAARTLVGLIDDAISEISAARSQITTVDTVVDAVKSVTDNLPESGALTTIGTDTARLTAARAQVLDDWINAGRLDAILDAIAADVVNLDGASMRGTDSAATASALATAQSDLDIITGADGATLATLQANYAPAKAGDAMALTTSERSSMAAAVWTESIADGVSLSAGTAGDRLRKVKWAVANKMGITDSTGVVALYKDDGTTAADVGAPTITDDSTTTTREALYGTT